MSNSHCDEDVMHPAGPKSPRLKRFRRGADGATIVEFALVAPPLMMLIVGVTEIGLMMSAQAILDNAAFSAARVGKTGYADTGKDQSQTILAAIQKSVASYLAADKITISKKAYSAYDKVGQPEDLNDANGNGVWDDGETFSDTNGNGRWDKDQGRDSFGGAKEVVLYTLTYNWTLHTPYVHRWIGTGGVVPLKSMIAVKNEPY